MTVAWNGGGGVRPVASDPRPSLTGADAGEGRV